MMRNRGQKKRIKDCLSQLKHLDSVYAAEIKKPEAEQDTDLLEECLETMSYLHDVVESLSRQTQIQRSGVGSRIVLRRVAIVAIALAVLLIGMSVAEAAGFRVWSALIHWDSRYLHVTYTPENQEQLTTDSPNKYANNENLIISDGHIEEEVICNSIEEALNNLGIHIMLPKYLPDGFEETIVTYTAYEDSSLDLTICWANADGQYITIFVSSSAVSEDNSISFAYLSPNDNRKTIIIGNVEYLLIGNHIHWIDNGYVYSLELNIGESDVEKVLESLSY